MLIPSTAILSQRRTVSCVLKKMLPIFIIIITCYEDISALATVGSSFLAVVHNNSIEDLLHNILCLRSYLVARLH